MSHTPDQIESIIRHNIDRTLHLSLATVRDNKPWVSELHFAYDDALNLYFRSKASRRHSLELTDNPQVSGTIVDKFGLGDVPLGLYFEGEAHIIIDLNVRRHAFESLQNRLKLKADVLDEANEPDGHQFYQITVKTWYVFGVFGGGPGQKLELPWSEQSSR